MTSANLPPLGGGSSLARGPERHQTGTIPVRLQPTLNGALWVGRFDPYAVLRELERERVTYVVVGGLARVIQGSDELTRGTDLTPSLRPQNLERLQRALETLNARRPDGKALELGELDVERDRVLELASDAGEVKIVLEPAGTGGYDDLRRRANRQPLGEGLRPSVAGAGDLVRMLEARGRDHDRLALETMQRVLELDRGLSWER